MHNKSLIYGVFTEIADCQKAVDSLKEKGIKGASLVVKKGESIEFNSAKVTYPMATYFKLAGALGALIGGLAGAIASPTLAMLEVFEVLTPIMAATGGAVLGGYFGVLIWAFLHTSKEPEFHLHRFEGIIENGAILVSVQAETVQQTVDTFSCLMENKAVEVISRDSSLDLVVKNNDNLEIAPFTANNKARLESAA